MASNFIKQFLQNEYVIEKAALKLQFSLRLKPVLHLKRSVTKKEKKSEQYKNEENGDNPLRITSLPGTIA
jgi:hypothetical protein